MPQCNLSGLGEAIEFFIQIGARVFRITRYITTWPQVHSLLISEIVLGDT